MRMVFNNSCNEGHKECNQMTHEMAAASTPTGVVLTHCEEGAAGCAAGVAAIEAREQDRMMRMVLGGQTEAPKIDRLR